MKRTILTLAVLALLPGIDAGAQAKVEEVVTSNYNRNSVSFVALQRGDSYDSSVLSAVKEFNPGSKFDINVIPTKSISVRKTRSLSSQNYSSDYTIPLESVSKAVSDNALSREVVSYIFGRDANGYMNDKLIRYRGNYDAKDQDVINARAARVGLEALGDAGHDLISRSYIVVVDPYMLERHVNEKGKVTWSASTSGFAYKLDLTPAELNDFYDKCWIYEDDDNATKDTKRRAFYDFSFPLNAVSVVSASGIGATTQEAITDSIYGLITAFENNLSDWEVAVTISAKKPLRAKIGEKEGLVNGARFRAYSYKEDEEGNLISVPRGYLRATEIADNAGMSTGETDPSEFYQISGLANIDEGWTIKQSNDARIGVYAGPRFGSLGTGAEIDADYLLNVKTNGIMQYILFTAYIDFKSANYVPMYLAAGYAYGIHLTRLFELAPYAMLGLDHLGYSSSTSDSQFLRESALVLEPGVRASINVAYPLQLVSKLGVDLNLPLGDRYNTYNTYVGHKTGVFFTAGVKWTF